MYRRYPIDLTRTSILVFGTDRDEIHSWANSVRDRCKEWGVAFAGPIAPPRVAVYRRGGEIYSKPSNADAPYGTWFDELDLTEDEKAALYPPKNSDDRERIFARMVRLEDDRAVRKIFNEEWSQDLIFRVETTDSVHSDTPHSEEKHLADVDEGELEGRPGIVEQLMKDFDLV